MEAWKKVKENSSNYYSVQELNKNVHSIDELHKIFPSGKADSYNMILFSTSGIHGSYRTIEEEEKEQGDGITFVIIQPRIVSMSYGTVYPTTEEDFAFLYNLRKTSTEMFMRIGNYEDEKTKEILSNSV